MPHLFGGLVLLVAEDLLTPANFVSRALIVSEIGVVAYSTREGSQCMCCCRQPMLHSGMLPGSTMWMNAFWMNSMDVNGNQRLQIDF